MLRGIGSSVIVNSFTRNSICVHHSDDAEDKIGEIGHAAQVACGRRKGGGTNRRVSQPAYFMNLLCEMPIGAGHAEF